MMKTHIRNAILLTPQQRMEHTVLTLSGGVIEKLTPEEEFSFEPGNTLDAKGCYVAPGFIDLHFHGAMGVDTMDAVAAGMVTASAYCSQHGVTTFYPTTWSASRAEITRVIDCVKECASHLPGARVGGVHLEGPYINPRRRGAQSLSFIRKPDAREYLPWLESGMVSILTCAPEVEGGEALIRNAVRLGARVAIGHSSASYEQVKAAANLGATQAAHLFNGMDGLHHRHPGTAGGILDDDRLLAQVICDGVHLHPAVVRLVLKAKSPSRIALITDSIRGAGRADAKYEGNGQFIQVKDGVARDAEGHLSGSTISMDLALRSLIAFTGCDLLEALVMVTSAPAEEMGLGAKKGRLAPGYDADLVFLQKDLTVAATMVSGAFVYQC